MGSSEAVLNWIGLDAIRGRLIKGAIATSHVQVFSPEQVSQRVNR